MSTNPAAAPDPTHRPPSTVHHPPLITFERVAMQFGPQPVLRDLNVQVRRGETLVVIGESGCGKTVLLKLIIGLLRPTAGRGLFDGTGRADPGERAPTAPSAGLGL